MSILDEIEAHIEQGYTVVIYACEALGDIKFLHPSKPDKFQHLGEVSHLWLVECEELGAEVFYEA